MNQTNRGAGLPLGDTVVSQTRVSSVRRRWTCSVISNAMPSYFAPMGGMEEATVVRLALAAALAALPRRPREVVALRYLVG
jgi:DNA-directed RNA polymerase specialized sigma24 family protein